MRTLKEMSEFEIWWALNQERVELWAELGTYYLLCALWGLVSGIGIGQMMVRVVRFVAN